MLFCYGALSSAEEPDKQIDAYYGTLSSVGGPFPPNSDLVKSYFDRIVGWTAFCPGDGIPYMNAADYVCHLTLIA